MNDNDNDNDYHMQSPPPPQPILTQTDQQRIDAGLPVGISATAQTVTPTTPSLPSIYLIICSANSHTFKYIIIHPLIQDVVKDRE